MRRLLRDEQGSITVLFALSLPVLLGMSAFALDLANLRYNNMRLQMAADAGALAGARQIADENEAVQAAMNVANRNAPSNAGQVTLAADVQLVVYDADTKTYKPSDATTPPNAVRVTASRNEAHGNAVIGFLTRFVGQSGSFGLSAQSIAVLRGNDGPACVYALNDKDPDALTIAGSTTVSLGCGVRVKSSSAAAISSNGNKAKMTASSICQANNPAQNPSGYSPAVKRCISPVTDPFASVAEPTPTNCKPGGNLTGTVMPGCYSGSVSFSGNVTLAAGTYYFQDSDVKINSNANIAGSEATLFLDGTSTLGITGNPSIKFSAPTSGPLAGIALFQSRSASNASLTISGNSDVAIDGAIYAPATSVTFTGSSTTLSPTRYGSLIAWKVHFTGNSEVQFAAAVGANAGAQPASRHASLVY